ncbi:hypothetical protein MPC4_40065 [Methylocella tundrae]|uniref:Uncharacterized protein n=1 Tax=Methylocella tundrae TaxID=227605 RepID=A0A8B6MBL1_METTU|nr:hypothetical protein MPC4_40065 [Methylocella tundrae]
MMDLKLKTISGRIEDEPRKFLLGVTRPARRGKLKARERALRFKAPQSHGRCSRLARRSQSHSETFK